VGAAWSRLWRPDDRGYGYIDERTPELAIAVTAAYRGRGVGRRMLDALIHTVAKSYAALSLSVRVDNPALRLYREVGFEELDGSDVADRAGGTSVTMRLDLTGRGRASSD
jgi:GNAT superfamily N-acetyltransferase